MIWKFPGVNEYQCPICDKYPLDYFLKVHLFIYFILKCSLSLYRFIFKLYTFTYIHDPFVAAVHLQLIISCWFTYSTFRSLSLSISFLNVSNIVNNLSYGYYSIYFYFNSLWKLLFRWNFDNLALWPKYFISINSYFFHLVVLFEIVLPSLVVYVQNNVISLPIKMETWNLPFTQHQYSINFTWNVFISSILNYLLQYILCAKSVTSSNKIIRLYNLFDNNRWRKVVFYRKS